MIQFYVLKTTPNPSQLDVKSNINDLNQIKLYYEIQKIIVKL